MLNQKDQAFLIEHFTFWDQLTEAQQSLLLSNTASSSYKKGETLHSADYDCMGVLLIKSGSIRNYIISEEGREVNLYRLETGGISILSASCVLRPITFDIHIEAETDCEILQLSPHIFSRLTNENIYVEAFSYQLVSECFSEVMCAMKQILFTSFDRRLAMFLIEETKKDDSDTLHMTHEQISKYLGTAREVVSRMLNHFAKKGYVELSRGGIKILNYDMLSRL
ncbi:MAG: Crp/Fnr family transcriptional regulator [bacterium]|nr:Crp/Fnr family transcriptional regulator [bacterium]